MLPSMLDIFLARFASIFLSYIPRKTRIEKIVFPSQKKGSLYHHEKNLVLHIKSKIVPTIVCFEIGGFF